MKAKIPCSVSIITRGEGLRPCLEALADFEEIIICHGNPKPEHLEVAREFGAILIPQYDTDEPNLTCVMDKAAVRERAMSASTLPWRFFMDRDDRLSKESIEEIRAIVTEKHPKHLVWRMPTRIFIAGKEIKHEATYPSYQTRLVHKDVHAHFRGLVHERLTFDEKKFPVGTMESFYDFHWSPERVKNYWGYLGGYAEKELQTTTFSSFSNFLYWGVYKRLRTIAGYLLWRLPAMYIRHGFKDSMPLSIELTIVRYHFRLLFGGIALYIRTRVWFIILRETLRGKDLNRILANVAVRNFEAYGRVLDIGGGDGRASYWRYLRSVRWNRITVADLDPNMKPDVVVDLERAELPFADEHFDTVLMFNLIEHINNRDEMLSRVRQILRPKGTLIGVVPFLVAVHPDPHDFVRLTDEGLTKLFERAGFSTVVVTPVGRGPIAASYYQSEFLWPRVLKLVLLPVVLVLDRILLFIRPNWQRKFPLSYAFRAVR